MKKQLHLILKYEVTTLWDETIQHRNIGFMKNNSLLGL